MLSVSVIQVYFRIGNLSRRSGVISAHSGEDCYWKNGQIVVDLTGLDDAMSRAKGMAYHSAGENANLASVILEVCAAEKDADHE